MNTTQTQQLRITLELTGGGRATSDPITVYEEAEAEGRATLPELVRLVREYPSMTTFRLQIGGGAVYFNPAHIVTAQIGTADAR